MNEDSIFAVALEKGSAAERQAYLKEACAGNAELRAQVEELLRASDDAGSFLNHAAVGTDATIAATVHSGDTHRTGNAPVSLGFLEPCHKADRIGRLGNYEIIEVVGHGGMGTVLRAFDTKLSRVVAVKVMAPELAANPTAVKRFQREATAAAAVHHDHVVTIHAVHDEERPPYLVMQFVEGQTLQQKIDREGALELKHILRIGSQMAAGLAAAHKLGLIHRDVKPANILLENGVERVKITDFGLARAADDVEITQTGLIAGTPQYMSPEQARGELVDARSDLFSLGSVLYTMCTGRPAFRAETTMGALKRVCDDAPRPIEEINPEILEWLCAIVDKLLEKQPERRFQSAAEVSDLLGQHLAHLQQPASCPLPARIVTTPEKALPVSRAAVIGAEANFFWATGIMSLVAFGLVVVAFLGWLRIAEWPVPLEIWFVAGGVLSLPVGLCILYGAQQVHSRQSHGWAMAAGILSLLPINPFLIFCWPVTIWSLLTVLRARTAHEVAAEQEPRKPSPRQVIVEHPILGFVAIVLLLVSVCTATYVITSALGRRERDRTALPPGSIVASGNWPTTSVELYKRASPSGWVSLFNGHDLSGWKAIPEQRWHVTDGVIHGAGPDAFLVSDVGDFEDFHLQAEFRINADGDAGIYFRVPQPNRGGRWGTHGLEAEIGIKKTAAYRTGALTLKDTIRGRVLVPATSPPHAADEWQLLEVKALGEHIEVLVNGQLVTDYRDPERKFRRGHIALASWEDSKINTAVEFRKVEIRHLSSEMPLDRPLVAVADSRPAPSQIAKSIGESAEPALPIVNLAEWGKFFDGDGVCEVERAERRVEFKLPGTQPQRLTPTASGAMNAPRLVHEAEGDFVIQVVVPAFARATAETSAAGLHGERSAGLIVSAGDDDFLRFGRASFSDRRSGGSWLHAVWYAGGKQVDEQLASAHDIGNPFTFLQIERRGNVLHLRSSENGTTWIHWTTISGLALPPRVTVGLAATSTTRDDFAPVFYDLRFTHSGADQRTIARATETWTALFNGRDLSGWEAHPQRRGNWRVEAGLLTGSGPSPLSHLFTTRDDLSDFHVRVEMKVAAGSDSGIHARCHFAPQTDKNYLGGYEVNATTTGAVLKTGTVYDPADALAPVTVDYIRADEWFVLEVIAEGNHFIVRVNDITVVDCLDPKNSARRGRISLQQFGKDTVVQFRKVEIRELPASVPAPAQAARAASPPALADQYESEFGVVTLAHEAIGQKQRQVTVTGSWDGRPKSFGKFTEGLYEPAERSLVLEYVDEAINVKGTARLRLSEDGQTLRGTYVNESGQSGVWTLFRRTERNLVRPVDLKRWGRFVDPSGECAIERAASRVTLTAPGKRPYNLLPVEGYNLDAPRLMQEMVGDFILQVEVPPYERPTEHSSSRGKDRVSFRAAGLVLSIDRQNLIRFERASIGEASPGYAGGAPYLHVEQYIGGSRSRDEQTIMPDDPAVSTWLEIERRGEHVLLRVSIDGKTWQPWRTLIVQNLPPRVSVGVAASNSTYTDFSPAFQNLSVHSQ